MATNFQLNVKAIVDSVDLQEQIKKIKIDPIKIQVDLGGTSGSGRGFAEASSVAKSFNNASDSVVEFRGKLVDTYEIAADGSRKQVAQMQTVQNGYNSQIQTLLELNKETKELSPVQQKIATDTAAGTSEIVRQGQAWKKLDAEIKSNYLKDLEYEGRTLQKNTEENKKYQAELVRQGQAWKKLDSEKQAAQDAEFKRESVLSKQFNDKVESNAAGMNTLRIRISGLTDEQNNLANASKRYAEIDKMTNPIEKGKAIRELTADVNAASRGTNTFAATLQYMTERFVQIGMYVAIFRKLKSAISDMVETVSSLDSSLVELRKVTDLSDSQLESFTKSAFEVGDAVARTGQEVIDATAIFKRSGYDIEDSLDLSETALTLLNVGDGIDGVSDAATTLISILKGYNLEADSAMAVTSLINEVSNNAAISFADLSEGLTRTSAVFNQAGVSIEETSGLLTGTNEVLQNIEKTSSGLITISQRLRAISEIGEDGYQGISKLSKAFKSIANIDIFDQQTGQLRDTYSILEDMSKVFPTLTKNQRQYLGEMAAG